MSEPEVLVQALREAMAHADHDDPTLNVHLAAALHAAGRHGDAFDAARAALTIDPGHIDALEVAGRACRALGQDARADRYADAAATLAAAATRSREAAEPGAAIVPL